MLFAGLGSAPLFSHVGPPACWGKANFNSLLKRELSVMAHSLLEEKQQNSPSVDYLKYSPLFITLLLAYPVALAMAATDPALPELGQPKRTDTVVRPNPNGLSFEGRSDDKLLLISPEYSDQTGLGLNAALVARLSDSSAAGLLIGAGDDQNEWLLNLGLDLGDRQRLVFSAGQLRQRLEYNFPSGADRARLTQSGGGISYQYRLGQDLLEHIEVNGYLADTASRDLADKTYIIDTASLYELWSDPRRIAGGKIIGLQGRLGLAPAPSTRVTLSLGAERLDYDLLAGQDRHDQLTGGIEWQQQLTDALSLKATADRHAAQSRYGFGLQRRLANNQNLGVDLTHIQGHDGTPDDSRVSLGWSIPFGGSVGRTAPEANAAQINPPATPTRSAMPAQGTSTGLLARLAQRPRYLPSQVVAKIDISAAPTRLIAVDKAGLPVGSGIDAATGDITVPLGVAVIGIAGISRDGGAFVNGGQFGHTGDSLVIKPSRITHPAVGDIDTYVVTLNNQDGSTAIVTIKVSHGSVSIDSIVITAIPAAPTASAVSISGTARVGETLTGHYTYADANDDPEATSTFRWLRNGVAIAGATAGTYTLGSADQGTTITFEVTPKTSVAPTTGTPVASSATASVAGVGTPAAPPARAVSISGLAQWDQTLTGHYTYADANNDPEATSTFRWLRNGVAIAGATASTYTLVTADLGATITFEVTPVSSVAPTTGTAVVSSATASVGAPAAPTASAVGITGTAQVGETLTGHYTYADANNDPEATSTFRWLRNGVAIAGATAGTYTLVSADQGTTITFEVTPVSSVAPTTGTAVVSSATVSVAGVGTPAAPTASAVGITGTAQVGETLTGHYTYADSNNDPEATSTYRWLRNGVAIAGATASTYTLVSADQGTTIIFEVTPVASGAPTTGTAVVSSATTTIAYPAAPTASALGINGMMIVGQPLNGYYTYADANNDPEATSSYRWLRNGVAIVGAVSTTYTPVYADLGATLTFEVTPKTNVWPTTGTPVVSSATAPIVLPAGYVSQGGLVWMPNNIARTWSAANTYCTSTAILGQTGWRLPTIVELQSLSSSGALTGQPGWVLYYTWSSLEKATQPGSHYVVDLYFNTIATEWDEYTMNTTCVR
jgi:hypothetical protein